jgi:hypothetical protein
MLAFPSKRSFHDYSALASFLAGIGIVNVNVEPAPIRLFTQTPPAAGLRGKRDSHALDIHF